MTGHTRLEGMVETRGRGGICLGNQIRAGHRSWDKVRATERARSISSGQRNWPGREMKIPSAWVSAPGSGGGYSRAPGLKQMLRLAEVRSREGAWTKGWKGRTWVPDADASDLEKG